MQARVIASLPSAKNSFWEKIKAAHWAAFVKEAKEEGKTLRKGDAK
jgi:hypothetical protein